MHIKFRSPVRHMRVNLALFRGIIGGLMRRSGIQSRAPFQIPKDIHTIVDQYDLNPTVHVAIACPKCYALSPFTDETLQTAENALEAHLPLPVCEERIHPDSPPCGTTLWHTRHSGKRLFMAPIRKQVFQDLKAWIGRILAVPGIEDAIAEHQQCPFPARSDSASDFVDSVVFREFKGIDGQPFVTSQKGPAQNPDLRLVMSLGFDGFNPFGQRETHAQIQSTALYMVILSLPEHLRYRQEYMFLVTVMPGKPKQNHVNHTLRILVKQLLAFWEGVYYTRTARHRIGRKVFVVLLPIVCDTEAAIQISGFAAHNHTYFCRRCLLPISDIYNLDPETWIMRDPAKHRELAFEWKVASRARREAIYKAHGIRFTELMELPYWDPILYTVIDDMHFGYLGLFKTHLREIWGIDHERNSGDGLHPDLSDKKRMKLSNASLRNFLNEIRENEQSLGAILLAEKKGVLWYLCFWLKLRTGLSSKQQMVEQILQWVSLESYQLLTRTQSCIAFNR
ncbi:hypothetical protein HHX47_DHR12000009 [Lentinula edodes]|nr:hypothetical protein HHX47_DHR12000009 [Lentinula edodes]